MQTAVINVKMLLNCGTAEPMTGVMTHYTATEMTKKYSPRRVAVNSGNRTTPVTTVGHDFDTDAAV